MFGLTLTKLIVIAAVIIVAWKGWRVAQAVLQGREAALQRQARPAPRSRPTAAAHPQSSTELVECVRCGLYVPNGTICRSLEECPYRDRRSAPSA